VPQSVIRPRAWRAIGALLQAAIPVVAAKLLTGEAGRSKIVRKAKKAFTPTPAVPLTLPVTVQLQNANGGCWRATYSAALIDESESGLFKAKSA
jgi:hypothetical protein